MSPQSCGLKLRPLRGRLTARKKPYSAAGLSWFRIPASRRAQAQSAQPRRALRGGLARRSATDPVIWVETPEFQAFRSHLPKRAPWRMRRKSQARALPLDLLSPAGFRPGPGPSAPRLSNETDIHPCPPPTFSLHGKRRIDALPLQMETKPSRARRERQKVGRVENGERDGARTRDLRRDRPAL
jgi:hypothetical protein